MQGPKTLEEKVKHERDKQNKQKKKKEHRENIV